VNQVIPGGKKGAVLSAPNEINVFDNYSTTKK
jgi:hypothetical protein